MISIANFYPQGQFSLSSLGNQGRFVDWWLWVGFINLLFGSVAALVLFSLFGNIPSPFFNEGMEAFFNAPKLIYIRHWHYAASMLIPVMSFRDRRDDDDNWTFLSVTRQRRTCYNPPTAEVNNRLLYTCALSLFFTWFLCSACAAEHWWRQRSIFITIESITINSHLLLIRDNKSVCQQMHRGRVESLEQQQPLAHMTQCRLITCWCCCVLSSADGTLNMFQWCMSFSD